MRPRQEARHLHSLTSSDVRALRACLQLTIVALVWTAGLAVIGAMVSATDASSQCSGWPLCNGQFAPAADFEGALIFAHRLGGFVMLLLSTAFVLLSQLRLRFSPSIQRLAVGVFTLVLFQSVVGGFAVVSELPQPVITLHLMLALAAMAAFTVTVVLLRARLRSVDGGPAASSAVLPAGLTGHLRAIAVALVVTLALGSITGYSTTSTTCESVGSCVESITTAFSRPGGTLAVHHILAIATAVLAVVFVAELRRSEVRGQARSIALGGAGAIILALAAGGALSLVSVPEAWLAAPLGLAAIGWISVVALLAGGYVTGQTAAPTFPAVSDLRHLLRDYARVTKPGIMLLLLVTTLGAMLIAAQGWPPLHIVVLTLLGGALASGGASALNCYYDRDIDVVMARTRKRPIPTGGLTPDQVRAFGLTLSILAVVVLAWFVNPLAATMALSGNLFYVLIYTRKLKRSTPQNIVIGGAAGSFPPLVGWAAVTGSLSLGAFLLAAIIFYWTPPHFWSLALLKANDYRRAGIPMLPVTHGEHETRRRILLYSLLLVAVTLLMVPAGVVGLIYGVTAAILGGWFVIQALRMFREGTARLAWPLFKYSNYYLVALLLAMAVDHAIRL